jgi:hypothetical protein
MKYTLIFLFTYIIFKQATGQPCAFYNSAEAPNYCCGHDPELKSQNVNQRLLDNQQGQENFCNTNHYILEDKSNASSLGGDWFLVWNDEFNYGLVDWSSYDTVIAGTNILPEGDGNVEQIYRGKNVSVTNGKLVYTAFNHSSPIEKFYYIDPADYITKYKHFDYSTGNTQTKIHFPLNAYHQANIRCAPNPNKLWSAYWLYGGGPAAQEIDMFEVTGGGVLGNGGSGAYSGSPDDPTTSLKMTYHYRKDANQFSTDSKAEGIHHKTNNDLTQNFNLYGLIWDKWKIQWFFNNQTVHEAFKYYGQKKWNNNKIQKQYREKPIVNFDKNSDDKIDKVMRNRHFPLYDWNAIPSPVITGFSIMKNPSPADVGSSKTMEVDFLKVWLRRSCQGVTYVTQNNFVYDTQYWGDIIVTGREIETVSGSNIHIRGGAFATNYSEKQMDAIYAALDEIRFLDGFGVEDGANLWASITSCDQAWDMRLANTNQMQNEEDSLIKNTDVVHMPTNDSYNINKDGIELIYNNSSIQINSSLGEIISLEFIDMKGSTVYSIKNSGKHSLILNKEDFATGMYTLKVQTTSNFDVKKVWVIR